MLTTEDESSVKVAVRIRPQIAREVIDGCRICTNVTPGEPQVTLGSDKSFTYDYVFDTHENQQTVYDSCASSLVVGALQGYNATILAYGQTGSGKTYTMGTGFDLENVDTSDPFTLGIIPRAIHQLFDGIQSIKQQSLDNGDPAPHFTVTAQFLELYNEEIIDLFDTTSDYSLSKVKSGIRIHEDMQHNIYVTGVSWKTINSAGEALSNLRQGALSRTTAATEMNSQSSRSHAVFTLNIQQKRFVKHEDEGTESTLEECGTNSTSTKNNAGEFETLTAKFHFVDLAGSERLKRTGATGDRAKEGISINCGLLALGNVISALGDKSRKVLHVPYRDSKLTRLLQDSLGGNSRTVMIACVSPSDRDFMETLNTLKYANRARNIQNKVVINQDKSSRTIQLLRQEIQQLQLEIMEYKQGKKTVNENGEECVNDTYIENTMLQTELSNMRARIKALQETIDVLTSKNTQLLAEKATGAWVNTDAGLETNMSDVIQGYLKEIEDLRAKLLESEHLCGQLRKNVSSPIKNHFTNYSNNDEYTSKELIAKAKLELENEKRTLQRLISIKSRGSETDSTNSDESEDNSSDDENECASVDSQYSQELANLTSEINLKQKLIEELELSQRRLANLRQHYEEKLQQLQTKIKLTQDERDTVLSSLGNSNTSNQSEKVKKVKDDYERKLTTMQKELKSLQSAKKEHAKLLRDQSQYENQIRTLKYEVNDMKRSKVKLMNKIKEETTRHHEAEMRKAKEIAQLRKESRRAEIRMRNLESKSRMRDVVLKRKQEEVTALRRAARAMNNSKIGASSNKYNQKNSKQTWINLEKNISALTLNKQTLYSLEKDMERLLQERVRLHSDLDFKLKKLADAQVQQPRDSNLHRDLEDEIEAIRANLDYVDENIKELQENILQVEDSKVATESLELNSHLNNLPDAIYILEKLYQMSLHNSCLAAQKDISVKELETKMQQLEKENEIQRQLIEHMLSSRDRMIDLPISMTTSSERDIKSVISSSSSSRSISPTEMTTSTRSDTGINKHRRRAAQAQELLFVSKSIEPQQTQKISLVRVPSASSFLRPDKYRPSPVLSRKQAERQESVSPRLIRRGTFIVAPNTNLLSKPGSMDRLNKSPPNSPPSHRRVVSRDENVFSRLTSSTTQSIEQHRSKGVIHPFQGKTSMKAPLSCTHITEGHSRAVLAVYAIDDLLFSASKDKTVKIWDLNSGKEIQTLGGHPTSVVAIKYDEFTHLALSVSSSYIKVWDIRLSRCIKTLNSSGIVNNGSVMSSQIPVGEILLNDIALNNYGRTLYMATGDKVKIWDMRKFTVCGKLSSGHTAAVMCLATGRFDNKNIIVTGSKDHYIKMFEVDDEAVGTYNPTVNLEPPHYDGIQSLAIHNEILFSGSRDYAIKKWDLNKQELVTSINNAHKDWICGLAFVPNQPLLLSVCRSGSLKMWSESTCALLGEMKAHDSPINAIATNSSHVFTAAHDGAVKLWRVKCRLDAMA